MDCKQDSCGKCCGKQKNNQTIGAFSVCDRVEYAPDAIVSSTVVDNEGGTLTIFAFDEGQALSTHSAPFDAVLNVVDGTAQIGVGNESYSLSAGEMVILPADIPHSVEATTRFKMILSMFKA